MSNRADMSPLAQRVADAEMMVAAAVSSFEQAVWIRRLVAARAALAAAEQSA